VGVRVALRLCSRRRGGRGCRSDLRGRGRIVVVVGGGGGGSGFGFVGAFGLAAATADGDIAKDAAFGPVAAAVLAEMAWLGEVVVVVVTELGVEGVTARALERLVVVLVVLSEPAVAAADGMYILHFRPEMEGENLEIVVCGVVEKERKKREIVLFV